MSSQGEMLDSDMVGLTGSQADEKLEESTGTARDFPQMNSICGFCTESDGSPTYIKHANQKVFRENKPMCIRCFNSNSGKPALTRKQFMKLSKEEHDEVMHGVDAAASRLSLRAAKNPKRSSEEVLAIVRKLTKRNRID